jgi:hypothetical protein
MSPAMSAFGTKRTSHSCRRMSAFGGKADIAAKLLTRDEARRIAVIFAKLQAAVNFAKLLATAGRALSRSL